MMDTNVDHEGWGYDLCFPEICNGTSVVLEGWVANHTQVRGVSNSIKPQVAWEEMKSIFANRRETNLEWSVSKCTFDVKKIAKLQTR